jgi:GTP-binding protein HflX
LLTRSAGAAVCAVVQGRRHSPDAATYAGKGKVEEVAAEVAAHAADLVIFNHELSAGQERNLERALQCRVIDRTSLILDIFAQRAQSSEGKLQVELAQLEHLATRLVRGWTHLERQKGGYRSAWSGRNAARNRPSPARYPRQAAQGNAWPGSNASVACSARRAAGTSC